MEQQLHMFTMCRGSLTYSAFTLGFHYDAVRGDLNVNLYIKNLIKLHELIIDTNCQYYFKPVTRTHNNLTVHRTRTEQGKQILKHKGVKIWNTLLTPQLQEERTIRQFKGNLKTKLLENYNNYFKKVNTSEKVLIKFKKPSMNNCII